MTQLSGREAALLIGTILFGVIFFIGVCAAIYFFFKRLERQDRAETEAHQPSETDSENDNPPT